MFAGLARAVVAGGFLGVVGSHLQGGMRSEWPEGVRDLHSVEVWVCFHWHSRFEKKKFVKSTVLK